MEEIQLSPVEVGSWLPPLFTRFGLHPRRLFGICEPSTVETPVKLNYCRPFIGCPYLHLQRSSWCCQACLSKSNSLAWQKKGEQWEPPLDPSCFLVRVKDSGMIQMGGQQTTWNEQLTWWTWIHVWCSKKTGPFWESSIYRYSTDGIAVTLHGCYQILTTTLEV